MAFKSRASSRYSRSGRGSYGRRTTATRRVGAVRRRSAGGNARRATGRGRAQTVRIVIEQPGASAVARPDALQKLVPAGRAKSKF